MKWVVVRQDDNGVKYDCWVCDNPDSAEMIRARFEDYQFKPHKMTYWVEERG